MRKVTECLRVGLWQLENDGWSKYVAYYAFICFCFDLLDITILLSDGDRHGSVAAILIGGFFGFCSALVMMLFFSKLCEAWGRPYLKRANFLRILGIIHYTVPRLGKTPAGEQKAV